MQSEYDDNSLLQQLLRTDLWRMDVLRTVRDLSLPQGYVAAGFVRNLIWDHLHGFKPTALNDVDVIYFDPQCKRTNQQLSDRLIEQLPTVKWQLKNQALMHLRNHDRPYESSIDAMRFWPEKETAVAVKLTDDDDLEIAAPFGLRSVFNGYITHNTRRSQAVFEQRLQEKKWLIQWPNLKVYK